MSLITKALKHEQQRRHAHSGPIAPMVSRMTQRRASDKLPLILFGFTGMGMLLAASIAAIFYFGSDYLGSGLTAFAGSPKPESDSVPTLSNDSAKATPPGTQTTDNLQELLGALTKEQLSTVQSMLLEAKNPTGQSPRPNASSETDSANETQPDLTIAEQKRVQSRVDTFSVQGIRKSGQETRVFLSGKIRKIGDVVDIETGLQLIGFTESALVFQIPSGHRFEKPL